MRFKIFGSVFLVILISCNKSNKDAESGSISKVQGRDSSVSKGKIPGSQYCLDSSVYREKFKHLSLLDSRDKYLILNCALYCPNEAVGDGDDGIITKSLIDGGDTVLVDDYCFNLLHDCNFDSVKSLSVCKSFPKTDDVKRLYKLQKSGCAK